MQLPDGVLRHLGIDGCVRLPIRVDAGRLADELDGLPADVWETAGGRDPVVQAAVDSFFAIGQPRGPRPVPPRDRPVLDRLPYLRQVLREDIPAAPTRAIVARLHPHGLIPIHTDTLRFFRATLRLSIQVVAEGAQRLCCNELWYAMAPGEVWAIDNLVPHGVLNSEPRPRLNVIADYTPSDDLIRLVLGGERHCGERDDAARDAFISRSHAHYRRNRWRAVRYELFKLLWRRG